MSGSIPIKGRGGSDNPTNRFQEVRYERDLEWDPAEDPLPRTQIIKDTTQTIIVYNQSPDVSFEAGINVYR